MTQQQFYEKLKSYGITLTSYQQQQFATYASILMEWNQKMDLTAITTIEEIYERHFLDSIIPAIECDFKGHMCDVGSGAGFPGIPLKIVYPDAIKLTIVEPLGKRVTFLRHLCESLNIDVILENKRSEDYVLEKREFFDVVSARGVANLTMLAELCIPLVKKGGVFIALKAQKGDIEYEEAKYALDVLGVTLEKQSRYELGGAKRVNFQFRKVKNTPKRYPRHYSKIKKSPIKEK